MYATNCQRIRKRLSNVSNMKLCQRRSILKILFSLTRLSIFSKLLLQGSSMHTERTSAFEYSLPYVTALPYISEIHLSPLSRVDLCQESWLSARHSPRHLQFCNRLSYITYLSHGHIFLLAFLDASVMRNIYVRVCGAYQKTTFSK